MAEEHTAPIVQVAFGNGKWWSIPREMSRQIYEKYINGEDAVYTWDWGEGHAGSWMPNGEKTTIDRYKVDFVNRVQTNIDDHTKRSIGIAWVRPQDVVPQYTGELPTTQT